MVADSRLQVVNKAANNKINPYGSTEDDADALASLSHTGLTDHLTKEAMILVIVKNLRDPSEVIPHPQF